MPVLAVAMSPPWPVVQLRGDFHEVRWHQSGHQQLLLRQGQRLELHRGHRGADAAADAAAQERGGLRHDQRDPGLGVRWQR